MKEFKFNEQSAIENMIKINFVDINNITNTIYSLAKYNYHALHLGDNANYNHILKYIVSNCSNVYEENIYHDIEGCINNAKKHKFVSISEVCITESEIEVIKSLEDIRQQKAIFVILATSKYLNALSGNDYDAVFLNNADICKMARITIPVNERDVFMQFAYDKGLLQRHTWPDSIIKKVLFISHNVNDKVVLRLSENDFKDLAYTYLAYLTPYKFRRCVVCKRWIRRDSKGRQICKECAEKDVVEKDNIKVIECVDCGSPVYVSIFNSSTCRCDVCQAKNRKDTYNKYNAKRRGKLDF